MAALEFLTAKRLCKKKVLTRLPVGHTHEDIDGCFGTLAAWFDRVIIQTPDGYKEQIEAAFNGDSTKLKCKVVDVFVVPNYKDFFRPYIDPKFSRYTKKEWTQHQYRFEAVTISAEFPLGSKLTYRKYSSDRVVVIDKKPIFSCTTREGIITGAYILLLLFCTLI